MARDPPAQERTETDADTKHHQKEGHDLFVHAQDVLPICRKKREQRRAKEPEPGHSESSAPHRRIGGGVAAHPNRLSHRVPIESKSGIARGRIGYTTTNEESPRWR